MPGSREDYVISDTYPEHSSFKSTFHRLFTRKAREYAESKGRKLAYGPPHRIYSKDYGDFILLWPLVQEVKDDLSG